MGLAMRRDEWLAGSLSRSKPWEAAGCSRRTWYRRQQLAQVEVAQVPEVAAAQVAEPELAQVSEPPLPLIRSTHGSAHACAQCNGFIDGKEREVVIDQTRVLLHPECERFWRVPGLRHPNVGGSWG